MRLSRASKLGRLPSARTIAFVWQKRPCHFQTKTVDTSVSFYISQSFNALR